MRKRWVPLHLRSNAGDSSDTHHLDESMPCGVKAMCEWSKASLTKVDPKHGGCSKGSIIGKGSYGAQVSLGEKLGFSSLGSLGFDSKLGFRSCFSSSYFIQLTREVKELKKHVHNLEIELLGDLKEIPKKITSTVNSLTTQVAELKTFQWELLAEFLSIPTRVKNVQAKIKTLDALPSLLNKVTEALNKFA
ncbi:hypothetical protein Tco_0592961 [Tanacetum coccineum]